MQLNFLNVIHRVTAAKADWNFNSVSTAAAAAASGTGIHLPELSPIYL